MPFANAKLKALLNIKYLLFPIVLVIVVYLLAKPSDADMLNQISNDVVKTAVTARKIDTVADKLYFRDQDPKTIKMQLKRYNNLYHHLAKDFMLDNKKAQGKTLNKLNCQLIADKVKLNKLYFETKDLAKAQVQIPLSCGDKQKIKNMTAFYHKKDGKWLIDIRP